MPPKNQGSIVGVTWTIKTINWAHLQQLNHHVKVKWVSELLHKIELYVKYLPYVNIKVCNFAFVLLNKGGAMLNVWSNW